MAVFTGTNANDSYLATTEGDNARGLRGDDTLIGNSGRDTLNGNADNDYLFADSATQTAGGNDSLYGGQGSDTLVGARFGFSADSLGGNRGEDLLIASTNGGNTLFGGQGDDTIYGSLSNGNTMNGDLGNDVLVAGRGDDRMLGSDGNDTLKGGVGNNQMFGAVGNDVFQFFAAKANPDVTLALAPEQLTRNSGGFGGNDIINDFATGDQIQISDLDRGARVRVESNGAGGSLITITGSALGTEQVPVPQSAAQTINVVGVGRDSLLGPGSNFLNINGQNVTTTTTGSPNITVETDSVAGVTTYTIGGTGSTAGGRLFNGSETADSFGPTVVDGRDGLTTVNDDTINGAGGNDFINGAAGNDIERGDAGADTLRGDTGLDTLTGGAGSDIFRFSVAPSTGVDNITDFTRTFAGGNGFDRVEVSASAFGGALRAGQLAVAAGTVTVIPALRGAVYEVLAAAGAPPTNAVGFSADVAAFYYDTAGGGLYFDGDGSLNGFQFQQFAQLSPAPTLINAPIVGATAVIDIIA